MAEFNVHDQPPASTKTNSLALISMIIGILSVLLLVPSFCIPCLHLIIMVMGLAAAILGFLGRKQIDESQGTQGGRPMAMAGLIMGVVVFVVVLLYFLMGLIFGFTLAGLGTLPFLEEILGSGF